MIVLVEGVAIRGRVSEALCARTGRLTQSAFLGYISAHLDACQMAPNELAYSDFQLVTDEPTYIQLDINVTQSTAPRKPMDLRITSTSPFQLLSTSWYSRYNSMC